MRAVPLTLKASLHAGPCLAVNANDRLDFFGTTINLAARMVSCCQGGDLVVSDELFHRPEMRDFLKQCDTSPEPSDVRFRGFNDPRRIWRVELGPSKVVARSTMNECCRTKSSKVGSHCFFSFSRTNFTYSAKPVELTLLILLWHKSGEISS